MSTSHRESERPNTAQRFLLIAGIVLLSVAFLVPPYQSVLDVPQIRQIESIGYHWRYSPPADDYPNTIQIDSATLYSEWVFIVLLVAGLYILFRKSGAPTDPLDTPNPNHSRKSRSDSHVESASSDGPERTNLPFSTVSAPNSETCQLEAPVAHLTILIGEHDKIMIDLITELVQEVCGINCGLDVVTTYNGVELPKLVEEKQADLVVICLNNIFFVDENKGPVSMTRAVQLIGDLKKNSNKPVIAISGLSGYEEQVMSAGAEYFFDRPFEVMGFQNAVKTCLNRSLRPSEGKRLHMWLRTFKSNFVTHAFAVYMGLGFLLTCLLAFVGLTYGLDALYLCLCVASAVLFFGGNCHVVKEVSIRSYWLAAVLFLCWPVTLVYAYSQYSEYGKAANVMMLGIALYVVALFFLPAN